MAGNAGVLLAEVLYLKPDTQNFALVDAAMNDLMRPALYRGLHDVPALQETRQKEHRYDIVGPVCESGDFLARDRELALNEGRFDRDRPPALWHEHVVELQHASACR